MGLQIRRTYLSTADAIKNNSTAFTSVAGLIGIPIKTNEKVLLTVIGVALFQATGGFQMKTTFNVADPTGAGWNYWLSDGTVAITSVANTGAGVGLDDATTNAAPFFQMVKIQTYFVNDQGNQTVDIQIAQHAAAAVNTTLLQGAICTVEIY